jgi:hypothetical protein
MSEIETEDKLSDEDITALIVEQDEEIKNLKQKVADLESERETKKRIGQPVGASAYGPNDIFLN